MPPRPSRGRSPGRLGGLAAAVLVLSACGGDGDGDENLSAGDATTTTTVGAARPDFLGSDVQVRAEDINFPQDAYRATAGEVTIGYVNEGKIFHTLALAVTGGEGVEGWDRLEVSAEGDVAVGTVTLTPGEYVLYCDVAGHRTAGMEATLTVEGPVTGAR